ncbi:MAG TPA: kelch repeat-containing protein, partial [Polyangia bacterium]
MDVHLPLAILITVAAAGAVGCTPSNSGLNATRAGTGGTGGNDAMVGQGGAQGTGGSPQTGATQAVDTGGTGAAGASMTAGATGTGGGLGTGGSTVTGGAFGTGGSASSGGARGTGGTGADTLPLIASFTALPASIPPGGSATLRWAVTGATTLSIDQGIGLVTGTNTAVVTPAQTTTYTLTAQNAAGASVTSQAQVTVPPLPSILSFTASPASISAGQSATLTAVFVNGTGSIDNGIGPVTVGVGVSTGPLQAGATYTLTVLSPTGGSTSAQVTVSVGPSPAIVSFTSAATSLASGKATTLTATFVNGAGSIDNGIGSVSSGISVSTGLLVASTTFTLTVANAAGTSVTAKVTITVSPPIPAPTITSFTASPTTLASGTRATLTATFAGGTGVIDHGVGSVSSGVGTSTGALTAATTFTLTVTNTAQVALTATVTVTVEALGSFVAAGAMSTARYRHTATSLPNGKVLIAGGYVVGSSITVLASTELFDPATSTFAAAGSMTTARYGQTATLLPNGKVLIAGGLADSSSTYPAAAELYDPTTGTFAATASMVVPRMGHTTVLLANGTVFLVGGYSGQPTGSAQRGAELYDPGTGTFAATGSMASLRQSLIATQLANGAILVAGGHDNSESLTNADLYDPSS